MLSQGPRPSVARFVASWLRERGVEKVFAVPGLQIDPFLEACAAEPGIDVVLAGHETTAGYMADGFARAGGRVGVCACIGSVGASAAYSAALSAAGDHSRVLFLTGASPVGLRGCAPFQDTSEDGTDDVGLFRRVVRSTRVVESPGEVVGALEHAWRALARRPGLPCHVALPHDVLNAELEPGSSSTGPDPVEDTPDLTRADAALELLKAACRVAILAGIRAEPAEVRDFARRWSVPYAVTLSRKGDYPDDRLHLGHFGYGGSRRANEALLDPGVDLLLVLGAQLGERATQGWNGRLKPPGRRLVRVDAQADGSAERLAPDLHVRADAGAVLRHWLRRMEGWRGPFVDGAASRTAWAEMQRAIPACYPPSPDRGGALEPDRVFLELRRQLPDDAVLVADAGGARVFGGHFWTVRRPGTFYSSEAVGAMGWAIGASIGVQLARPRDRVVLVTGDGSMMMHGMELAVLRRYRLPVLVVVLDNGGYGAVASRVGAGSAAARELGRTPPVDWCAFAGALGVPARPARTLEAFASALEASLAALDEGSAAGPRLVQVSTTLRATLPRTGLPPSAWDRLARRAGAAGEARP